ncbi:MAG: outer membrane protein assembly factor BamD [Saprospiraceae bacterium]
MWKKSSILLVLGLVMTFISCQSTYDKLLTSTDNELKLKTANEYNETGEYYKAQMLYEQVMPFYRGTPQIDTIYFNYAYTHYKLENYILASYYFKNFTQTFTNSVFSEEAAYMTAFSNYQMSPNLKLDQTYTFKAIEGFQFFANKYPTSEKVATCNSLIDEMRKKLEEKAVENAELYYRLSNYQSADKAFKNLLIDYPESKDAEKIRYRIVQASYKQAENTIELKQVERYETVIKNCNSFKSKHSESDYSNQVEAILKDSKSKIARLTDSSTVGEK